MNIYKVTLNDNVLYLIAEDKDHVITLISTALGTTDYFSLMRDSNIEQVAGPMDEDSIKFYAGL